MNNLMINHQGKTVIDSHHRNRIIILYLYLLSCMRRDKQLADATVIDIKMTKGRNELMVTLTLVIVNHVVQGVIAKRRSVLIRVIACEVINLIEYALKQTSYHRV